MTAVDTGMLVLFPGPLTNEQYFALPESNLHIELFEGKVLMAPAPTPEHQGVTLRVARALLDYAERNGGIALIAPVDIEIGPGMVLQPDALYFGPGRTHLVTARRAEGAPDLVVEVLSPGTRRYDMQDKRPAYASAGVTEFWAVDLVDETVTVYRNERGALVESSAVAFGESIPSTVVDVGAAGLRRGNIL